MSERPKLVLPKRYEALTSEAKKLDADLTPVIQPVTKASARVRYLLGKVRDGGLGRFELFLGLSGSGKTTFFRSLSRFHTDVTISEVPAELQLEEVQPWLNDNITATSSQILIIDGRDNFRATESERRDFFEGLRVWFRQPDGKVLVVWPITDSQSANELSETAWDIGRDSLVDLNKGIFEFEGVPKPQWASIADVTAKSLNGGHGLEEFGVATSSLERLVTASQTLAEFYQRIEEKAFESNRIYDDLLRERVVPHLWVVVGGDDNRLLEHTVATLTQGTENLVDVDRILSFLDNPDNDAAYLRDWKRMRPSAAYLLRRLDVRLFILPTSVSLGLVRCFGSEQAKNDLKLKTANRNSVLKSLRSSGIYQALRGSSGTTLHKKTALKSAEEYRRLQQSAKNRNKDFNRAIGAGLGAALSDDQRSARITCEEKLPDGNIIPDIRVELDDEVYCIEPTWRSSGQSVMSADGALEEVRSRQNTLTTGHIQMYLLEKAMNYVKDLGWDTVVALRTSGV